VLRLDIKHRYATRPSDVLTLSYRTAIIGTASSQCSRSCVAACRIAARARVPIVSPPVVLPISFISRICLRSSGFGLSSSTSAIMRPCGVWTEKSAVFIPCSDLVASFSS
jgi:hypothetical protein